MADHHKYNPLKSIYSVIQRKQKQSKQKLLIQHTVPTALIIFDIIIKNYLNHYFVLVAKVKAHEVMFSIYVLNVK